MNSSKTQQKQNTSKSKTKKTKIKGIIGKKGKTPKIETFSSAVSYLLEQTDFERMRVVQYDEQTFKLDRMKTLLAALGNPHDKVAMISWYFSVQIVF